MQPACAYFFLSAQPYCFNFGLKYVSFSLQLYSATFDVVFGEVTEANLRGFGTKQVGNDQNPISYIVSLKVVGWYLNEDYSGYTDELIYTFRINYNTC